MSIVLTALIALTASPAAQASAPEVLYTPVRDASDQKITVKGWGSGTGSETDETAYEGSHSIRVSTRNFFQGADIKFGDPKDLTQRFGDRNNLLKITMKTSDDETVMGGGATGGGRPGVGGMPGGMMGGPAGMGGGRPGSGGMAGGMGGPAGMGGGRPGTGGMPGGMMGGRGSQGGMPGGMMGGRGGPGGMMGGAATTPALTTVRVIITTTDGKKSETYLPISTSSSGERGWKTVSIPLQAINGFDRTNKMVQDIAFSGDATTTFYVGDLRVVNDSTSIRGEILGRRSYNAALGDPITFQGSAQGGASVLEYVWDFDDSDGIQADAIGQTVTHKFRHPSPPGKKTLVTLTVRDKYGLKPPSVSTVEVTVNP